MKRIIVFCISIFFFNCAAKRDISSDKRLVKEFIENVILSKTSDNKNLERYLKIYDDTELEKRKHLEFIDFAILGIKETIKDLSHKTYNIYTYQEAEKYHNIKSSIAFKNIEYSNLNDVLFVIFNNNSENVFIYIVENDKITSFFSKYIRFNKETDPMIPYMLNEPPEEFKAINYKKND